MTMLLATLVIHPLAIERHYLWLLPLCLAVALVYKTTKCAEVREIPLAALISWLTIVVGMYAVGAALWLLYHFAA